jgi:hypothetical protein
MTSSNNKTLNARLLARVLTGEKVNMDFYFVELHSKILVGDKNLL